VCDRFSIRRSPTASVVCSPLAVHDFHTFPTGSEQVIAGRWKEFLIDFGGKSRDQTLCFRFVMSLPYHLGSTTVL
jgi:hypothetical protein